MIRIPCFSSHLYPNKDFLVAVNSLICKNSVFLFDVFCKTFQCYDIFSFCLTMHMWCPRMFCQKTKKLTKKDKTRANVDYVKKYSACVADVKFRPVLHHCVFIFSWSSGIIDCMLFTFINRVPLMLLRRQWCSILHYYWWKASIKPRLLLHFIHAG